MKPPTVYYSNHRDDSNCPLEKIDGLLTNAKLGKMIHEDDVIAVKTHIGEEGSVRYLRPTYIRKVVDFIKDLGGNPFVTDTTALYPGARFNAVDNIKTAARNGFTRETIGAPIVIADGVRGYDGVGVAVDGKYLKKVNVARALSEVDAMVVVSHFKLHEFTGFGGAIKNLGMGCVTKDTKAACHRVNRPFHLPNKCTVCKECIEQCKYDCIKLKNKKIQFDRSSCKGCLACYFNCDEDAYKLPENIRENLQKVLAESAFGVTKFEFCDCAPMAGVPVVPDLGYLLSNDPVAVDAACVDLIDEDFDRNGYSKGDWDKKKMVGQIEYAEKVKLGSEEFRFTEI
jgi:uncharacterized Fe-S center protein